MRNLADLIAAQLEFHKKAYEILSELAPVVDGLQVEQEVCREKCLLFRKPLLYYNMVVMDKRGFVSVHSGVFSSFRPVSLDDCQYFATITKLIIMLFLQISRPATERVVTELKNGGSNLRFVPKSSQIRGRIPE